MKPVRLDVDFTAEKTGPETTFVDRSTGQKYFVSDMELCAHLSPLFPQSSSTPRMASTLSAQLHQESMIPPPDGRRDRHELFGVGSRIVFVAGENVTVEVKKLSPTNRKFHCSKPSATDAAAFDFYHTGAAPSEGAVRLILSAWWRVPVGDIILSEEL